jgi:hypothetical protein|tara:strand:- start:2378 stop:2554 length:177 start_codon:yes stop_codon:yes gene_type:complete
MTEILMAAAFIHSLLLRLVGHARLIGVMLAKYAMHPAGVDTVLGPRSFFWQRNAACSL